MDDKEYSTKLADRVFECLEIQLEKFLSEGKCLYLVTDVDSHHGPNFLLNEIISRVYKNRFKHRVRISIYFTGVIDND